MKFKKILIIEDLVSNAIDMEEQLIDLGYHVVGIAKNSTKAISIFHEQSPDILISDIHLKNSPLNGIQTIEQLNKIKQTPVIFITAHGDSIIRQKIKQIEHAYFLDKPWHQKQLESSIDFCIHNFLEINDPTPDVENEKSNCFKLGDFFFLKKNKKFIKLHVDEIIYIKAAGVCVEIFSKNTKHVVSTNLSNFFRQINHKNLLRVHKSYGINFKFVDSFMGNTIILQDGDLLKEIPIGISYKTSFNDFFVKLKTD